MSKEFRKRDEAADAADDSRRVVVRRPDSTGPVLTPLAPQRAGASFFFEVKSGWELRALADDENVRKVYTTTGLEDAFHDQTVRTILVPRDASISKNVVLRVCGRHGHGKTVFFEVAAR